MPVVSSIDTRSTQSKVSPTRQAVEDLDRPARGSAARGASGCAARRPAATTLRWAWCFGAVHRDEAGLERELRVRVADHDAARRREGLGVLLDVDDVVEARDRPVGTELALRAVVDRVLLAQALEVAPVRVGLEELGVRDVDLVERNRVGIGAGLSLGGESRSLRRTGSWDLPGQGVRIRDGPRQATASDRLLRQQAGSPRSPERLRNPARPLSESVRPAAGCQAALRVRPSLWAGAARD